MALVDAVSFPGSLKNSKKPMIVKKSNSSSYTRPTVWVWKQSQHHYTQAIYSPFTQWSCRANKMGLNVKLCYIFWL